MLAQVEVPPGGQVHGQTWYDAIAGHHLGSLGYARSAEHLRDNGVDGFLLLPLVFAAVSTKVSDEVHDLFLSLNHLFLLLIVEQAHHRFQEPHLGVLISVCTWVTFVAAAHGGVVLPITIPK